MTESAPKDSKSRSPSKSPKGTLQPASSKPRRARRRTIRYRGVSPGILRPLVTFTLKDVAGNLLPPLAGLVDSGADGSMFPVQLMPVLGIKKSDCTKRPQMGADGQGEFHDWNKSTLPADFYGVEVQLKMQFSQTPFILLGREDFFSTFEVCFDQVGLKFSIKPY